MRAFSRLTNYHDNEKKKVLKKIKGKQRLNNLRPGAKHTLVMLLDILSPLQGFKMHRVIKKGNSKLRSHAGWTII